MTGFQRLFRETLIKRFPREIRGHEVPFLGGFLRMLPEASKEKLI